MIARNTYRAGERRELGPILLILAIVALLYFGRSFLIPIALSFLLVFVAGPAIRKFEQLGLKRPQAITVLVILASITILITGWLLSNQLLSLSENLSSYRGNLSSKITTIEQGFRGAARWVQSFITPPSLIRRAEMASSTKTYSFDLLTSLHGLPLLLPTIAHLFVIATFIVVLTLFLIAARDELRDRLIRLAGESNIHFTAEMLDEISKKVSAYLSTQVLVNMIFGIVCGAVLALIGIPFYLVRGDFSFMKVSASPLKSLR